jgi:hypothetical protein
MERLMGRAHQGGGGGSNRPRAGRVWGRGGGGRLGRVGPTAGRKGRRLGRDWKPAQKGGDKFPLLFILLLIFPF